VVSYSAEGGALFVYDFDLVVDYLPGKPVDRHPHTRGAVFAFDGWREGLTFEGAAGKLSRGGPI
jgi:hypothetical protein